MAARILMPRDCSSLARHLLLTSILGALFFSAAVFFSLTSGSSVPWLARDFDSELGQRRYATAVQGGSRHLLQTTGIIPNGTFYALATSRTDRPNPLNHFRTYRGGFDIKSTDYGRSLGYTGLPAFVLTLVWVVLGLLLFLTLLCTCCCCRHRAKSEYDHGRLGYILPLLALILFTIAAIIGSGVLYRAQYKFNKDLKGTLNYVVDQSIITETGLREVSSNLTDAAGINIEGVLTLSDADKAEIQQLNSQLNSSANDLHDKTVDNRRKIKRGINIARIVLIVVSAVMLALVLLGLIFSACGVRSIVYLLVIVGWILVTVTCILCAVFIIVHNGVGDGCLAMEEWVANPQANTSLDRFLPCVDQSTANSALSNSRKFTVEIIGLVNQGLDTLINQNFPPRTRGWYNQTGPLVPNLCNNYGPAPDYTPIPCVNGTVTFAQAPDTWASFVCTTDNNGICTTTGRLTSSYYAQLTNATRIGGALSSNANFLVSTANCTFVRDTFTEIDQNRCSDLRKEAKWIWIGLILVSGGAMLSILSWIVYVRRRKYRYRNRRNQQPIYKGQPQQVPAPPPPAGAATAPPASSAA